MINFKKTYKIPFVSPNLFIQDTVVIVGSSSSILNINGQEIDAFDTVIRFNRAPTAGYENFVGKKTSLRVLNNHVFDNVDISDQGFTNQPKKFIKKLRKSNILYIGRDNKPWEKRKKNSHKSNKLFKFQYEYSNSLKNTFNINSDPSDLLTIGTIFTFLCVISDIKPTLYGFDLDNEKRTHYFEDRPDYSKTGVHKISEETKKLSKLNRDGIIQVFK